jgi:hypothetical protein
MSGSRQEPARNLSRRSLRRIGERDWHGIRATLILGLLLIILVIVRFIRTHDRELREQNLDSQLDAQPTIRNSR